MEVKSSHIREVEYDPETRTLHLTFRNGQRYAYHGVHPGAHKELLDAKSIGTYFHRFVRGRHREEKLKG